MANLVCHTPSYMTTLAAATAYWDAVTSNIIPNGTDYQSSSGGSTFTKNVSGTGFTVGFNWRHTIAGASLAAISFDEGATNHCDFVINTTTGIWTFRRNGTVLLTSVTALSVGTQYYMEFQVTIADSGGVAIMKIDGVTDSVINSSSLDTRNAATGVVSQVTWQVTGSTGARIWNIYLNDNTGGVDDTFWGPITVGTMSVAANGNQNDWTPSASTNNTNVDDASLDSDTTYNATSTNGHIDLYAMTNTGYSAGTVKGVEWVSGVRRTDAPATGRVAPVYRIGGTNYVRSDIQPRQTYRLESQRDRLSPSTGVAWTVSELDNLEAGIKRTAA